MSRPTKYIQKIRELRAKLWPDVKFRTQLWHRKRNDGFVTVPRTMPLVVGIIDDLTKGAPAGMTYAELWCRTFDEMYVSLSRAKELAFHAGFTGQRAERTWAEKVRKLAELGFIKVKEGQAGPLSHALVLNPYLVIKRLYESGHPGVSKDKYNALVERAIEIGASDLDDDFEEEDADDKAKAASSSHPAPVKSPSVGKPSPGAKPRPSLRAKIPNKPKGKAA